MSVEVTTWRNQDPHAPESRRYLGVATTTGKGASTSVFQYGPTEPAARQAIMDWIDAEREKAERPRLAPRSSTRLPVSRACDLREEVGRG